MSFSSSPSPWLATYNTLGVYDAETEEKLLQEHESIHRISYQTEETRLLVLGYWRSAQVQSGAAER